MDLVNMKGKEVNGTGEKELDNERVKKIKGKINIATRDKVIKSKKKRKRCNNN